MTTAITSSSVDYCEVRIWVSIFPISITSAKIGHNVQAWA